MVVETKAMKRLQVKTSLVSRSVSRANRCLSAVLEGLERTEHRYWQVILKTRFKI